jgi:hypothetical protein
MKCPYQLFSTVELSQDVVCGSGSRVHHYWLHVPAILPPQERSPRYPLSRKLGRPRAGLDAIVLEKNFLPLLGVEPRSSSPSPGWAEIFRLLPIGLHKTTEGLSVFSHGLSDFFDSVSVKFFSGFIKNTVPLVWTVAHNPYFFSFSHPAGLINVGTSAKCCNDSSGFITLKSSMITEIPTY